MASLLSRCLSEWHLTGWLRRPQRDCAGQAGAGWDDARWDDFDCARLDESVAYSAYLAGRDPGAGALDFAGFVEQWRNHQVGQGEN